MLNKKLKLLATSIVLILTISTIKNSTGAKLITASKESAKNKNSIILVNKKLKTNNLLKSSGNTRVYLNQIKVAPSTFNPLTATDRELKNYGFPLKPKNNKNLAQWKKAMMHAKKYVTPVNISHSNIRHATLESNNWVGYVAQSSANNNDKFTETSTEFTLPQFNGSNTDDPAIWTGIGGASGTGSIVQAGVDLNATGKTTNGESYGGSTKYEFWVEDFPRNVAFVDSPTVNPGDDIYVIAYYSADKKKSYAFLEDETTQKYTVVLFDGDKYDGLSADYICEATASQYHGNWPNITLLSNNARYNTSSGGTGDAAIDGLNYDECTLWNNKKLVAEPSAIKGGNFTINTY